MREHARLWWSACRFIQQLTKNRDLTNIQVFFKFYCNSSISKADIERTRQVLMQIPRMNNFKLEWEKPIHQASCKRMNRRHLLTSTKSVDWRVGMVSEAFAPVAWPPTLGVVSLGLLCFFSSDSHLKGPTVVPVYDFLDDAALLHIISSTNHAELCSGSFTTDGILKAFEVRIFCLKFVSRVYPCFS